MILFSPNLVIATADRNAPRVYYHNIVTASAMGADEEAEGEPAINAANTSTALKWRGTTTAEQHLQIALPAADTANYIAIAAHNLGTAGISVTFESSLDLGTWTALGDPVLPADDVPIVLEFHSTFARYWRATFSSGSAPPAVGVIYLGTKLQLQRHIYVGHSPITLSRKSIVSNGRSESGQFLGRVLRSETLSSAVAMRNITPAWYRANIPAFQRAAQVNPFFFAWRPGTYPNEVGYAWMTNDISVSNAKSNGMMQFAFSMDAIA